MKMFLGEYNPNLTEGSRIALPKRIREQIRDTAVVVTKGFETCLYVYDRGDWQVQAEKNISSAKVDAEDAKVRDIERYVYSSAIEAPIDPQGRFVVPGTLLEYAGISSQTTVIGVGNRIEIWDQARWREYSKNISKELSQ